MPIGPMKRLAGLALSAMSSFDEELRRQEAEQRSADAKQRSHEDERRRAAEAAVPRILPLLREFSQRLSERGVQPQRVKLTERRGLRLAQFSPAGYVTDSRYEGGSGWRRLRSLHLVTPDGQLLWWSESHRDKAGFIPIKAENLVNGKVWLTGGSYITFGANGEPLVYSHGDPPSTAPLETALAACAMRLINESSGPR